MSRVACNGAARKSRAAARAFLASIMLLVSGCGTDSTTIELEILNRDDYAITGDLKIKACANREINPGELRVHIYVTENEEWGRLENGRGYEHYINPDFVSVPGVLGPLILESYWQGSADGCYTAVLKDAFVDTADWSERGLCPFRAIVVVAAYGRGAANGAEIIECNAQEG